MRKVFLGVVLNFGSVLLGLIALAGFASAVMDQIGRPLFGLSASGGLLFFLPLSPSVLCILYDGDVYSLPNDLGWIETNLREDVQSFNEHQFLNCGANIYFAHWEVLDFVVQAFEAMADRRPESRHRVHVAVLDKQEGDWTRYQVIPREELSRHKEALIHVEAIQPRPSRWPSMIKWRAGGRVYYNQTRVGYVRRWPIEAGYAKGNGYRKLAAR